MTFVGLLRHGEAAGGERYRGRTDDPLTALGWSQMRAAMAGLGRWDRVVSSPLQRCAAFAGEYALTLGLPLTLEAGLAEIDFGAWEGCSAAQVMEASPRALADFWRDPLHHPPPGGESLVCFRQRVVGVWETLCRTQPGKRLLLVTHGGVIRMLLCHLQGWPSERLLELEVKHAALFGLWLQGEALQQLFTSRDAMREWFGKGGQGARERGARSGVDA